MRSLIMQPTSEKGLCNACIQRDVADKTIRISEENWRWLKDHKRGDESFDEVLNRLRKTDRWSGFGALSDTDISEGVDEAHRQLEDEFRRDVDELTN